MHTSSLDPANSVGTWFAAQTMGANSVLDWTPETTLFADYRAFCSGTGITADPLSRDEFAAQLTFLCRRPGQPRAIRRDDGSRAYQPHWPRTLIHPARAAA